MARFSTAAPEGARTNNGICELLGLSRHVTVIFVALKRKQTNRTNLSTLLGHQSAASQASIASLTIVNHWNSPLCKALATCLFVLASTQGGRLSVPPENKLAVATAYLPVLVDWRHT